MALILLLMSVAAFAQTPGTAPYPPPGTIVDLGGYRVHVNCTGDGSPTVLIVGGGFSFDWTLVQQAVARTTRVCSYDPSGTAWSDPGPGRGCPAWVDEVHALAKRASLPGPYVLVGLSAGAIIARIYALEYPNEVAGVVIVDHAFLPKPDQPSPPKAGISELKGVDSPPALISATPIIGTHEDEPGFSNLPKEAQELDRWATSRNPDLPAAETAEQCMAFADRLAQGKEQPLGGIPLVVISTENQTPGYRELQKKLLALSGNSSQLIARESVHSVEITQPDVVADGILEVISAVRNGSRLKPSAR